MNKEKIMTRKLIYLILFLSTISIWISLINLGFIMNIDTSEKNFVSQDLNASLYQIEKNCGTTHITHPPRSSDWAVFRQICNDEAMCKFEYKNLTECLRD
jgi:hypothetical protein